MIPSIKTIETMLADPISKQSELSSRRAAVLIRAYMMGADNHTRVDIALDQINKVLQGYGIESIKDNQWDRYYCDIGLLYVNMGDTYIPTVIYDTRKETWHICSWGDYVEKYWKRFGGEK